MRPYIRAAIVAATLVPLSWLANAPAFAHATFETAQATPNSSYKGVLRIPHGCKGEATQTIHITIPEGVVGAKPMPKAGWTLSVKTGPYAKTYSYFGHPLSEGAKEIAWSNGQLPDAYYDEFVFSARLAEDLPVGQRVYFPTIQECANGSERWVGIPAAGQNPHALRNPAPGVMIVAANEKSTAAPMKMDMSAGSATAKTYKVGHLVITGPWARATPKGAPVAGGYLKITNNGTEADRLIGGSFPGAKQIEVHEMTMDNGVMRMRPVAKGLEIKPGQTVELKPGGYHLMFMGFKGQLKAGEQVKGTLTFQKAGSIDVAYQVTPMGGPAPGAGMHMDKGMHMDMHMKH